MNINITLITQMVVFALLIWFTMKFVWPMILGAMDERAKRIADGLAASEKGQRDLLEAKLKAEALVTATRQGLAECAGELGAEGRGQVEGALQRVQELLAAETPVTQSGDTAQLQSACAALDEATRPMAELLLDRAMEAMLRKRGVLK